MVPKRLLVIHRRPYGRSAALALTGLLLAALVPAAALLTAGRAAASATAATAATVGRSADAATTGSAGTPLPITNGNGTSVLVRNSDGTLYQRQRDPGSGAWGAWTSTGFVAAGDPAAIQDLDGTLELFAQGSDGHLYQESETPRGQGGWQDLGAPTGTTVAGRPVVVADDNTAADPNPNPAGQVQGNTDGRLEVFVLGADASLWHLAELGSNGGGWSAWEQVARGFVTDPTAAVTGDGRIAAFVVDNNNHLWEYAQKVPGTQQTPLPQQNWSGADLGGTWTGDAAVATEDTTTGTLLQVFGAHTDGDLWTATQSTAGSTSSPTGAWDLAHTANLGKAGQVPPVVAANSDGRLTVFGLNHDHLVTYRSQTSPAVPTTNPNGIWEGGWDDLTGQKVDSVAVENAPEGGFEVFSVGHGGTTLHQRGQLAPGTPSAPRGYWLDWTDLAPIGSGLCAGPGSLQCLALTNADLGTALDLANSSDLESAVIQDAPNPSDAAQQWSLTVNAASGNSTFSITNNSDNQCVGDAPTGIGGLHLDMAACDTSDSTQQWYLEPVAPASTTGKPTLYRIHQVGSSTCLTALKHNPGFHPSEFVERIDCTGKNANDHNTWRLGSGTTNAPGVLELALNRAAQQCSTTPASNSCSFTDTTTPAAYQAATGCVVSSILYNAGPTTTASDTVSWAHITGTEWSLGRELEFQVPEVLSTSFTASHSWIDQTSVTQSATVQVPPHQFGWVEYAPVVRETEGYWTFTLAGQSWTVPGRNLSVAASGTSGVNPITVTVTSGEPPTDSRCD